MYAAARKAAGQLPKAEALGGWNDIQFSFMLYGYNDEINLVVKITEIITTQPKNQSWMTLMTELNVLLFLCLIHIKTMKK